MYVFGSAGAWKTYEANRKAFDKWAIIPRMLRVSTACNLEVLGPGKIREEVRRADLANRSDVGVGS